MAPLSENTSAAVPSDLAGVPVVPFTVIVMGSTEMFFSPLAASAATPSTMTRANASAVILFFIVYVLSLLF